MAMLSRPKGMNKAGSHSETKQVYKAPMLILGQGTFAHRIVQKLLATGYKGGLILISGDEPWQHAFKPGHLLGNSPHVLAQDYPGGRLENKQGKFAELGDFMQDQQDASIKAVFESECPFQVIDAHALKIKEEDGKVVIHCSDGSLAVGERCAVGIGLGAYPSFESMGIVENAHQIKPSRRAHMELSNWQQALTMQSYFTGEKILILGGSGVASWCIERAVATNVESCLQVAKDYSSANPGGRNDEIVKAMENSRLKGTILSLKYLGSTSQRPDEPSIEATLEIELDGRKVKKSVVVDKVIRADGAQQGTPTAINSVYGNQQIQKLQINSDGKGLVLVSESKRICFASTSFMHVESLSNAILADPAIEMAKALGQNAQSLHVAIQSAERAAKLIQEEPLD